MGYTPQQQKGVFLCVFSIKNTQEKKHDLVINLQTKQFVEKNIKGRDYKQPFTNL